MSADPGSSLRWGAVLAFALFGPIGLPAGGSERRPLELRRRASAEPLMSSGRACLQVSPDRRAPALAHLPAHVPLRVLRRWQTADGEQWLQVEAESRRGWIASA
ncbi:MAG: hypothetical protein RLZZ32_187 [Cyanobacteriota bacterium]